MSKSRSGQQLYSQTRVSLFAGRNEQEPEMGRYSIFIVMVILLRLRMKYTSLLQLCASAWFTGIFEVYA